MTILFESKCLKECLKSSHIKSTNPLIIKKFYDIIYNESSIILFSKAYIEHLEKVLPDIDIFQALIKELNDANKLEIGKPLNTKTINDEFLELFKNCKSNFTFPITIDNDLVHLQFNGASFSKIKSSTFKFKAIDSLLTKGIYTASYQDFSNDGEIYNFFNEIFSIPRSIDNPKIFDREINSDCLGFLKGSNIFYYTLIRPKDNPYIGENKVELQKALGNKLKLYFTNNAQLIHERKIIIDGLIITSDNSFKNLTIKEPTWEISIVYNSEKALNWLKKCGNFRQAH